nr:ankyrin repeat domain-containing protein [Halolactibacillus miurensis]
MLKKKGHRHNMTKQPQQLIQAVQENDLDKVKEILASKDYDIHAQNERGESALLIATHHNQIDIAKQLILAGADVNQQDHIKDSAYLYAAAQGKTEILAFIIENSQPDQHVYNRYGGNTLIPAAEKGHLANVRLLLADGAVDIDHQNNFGYTALIEAVALRDGSKLYQDIVKVLLSYNADRTLRDHEDKTAADYAKELGYQELLAMLKE